MENPQYNKNNCGIFAVYSLCRMYKNLPILPIDENLMMAIRYFTIVKAELNYCKNYDLKTDFPEALVQDMMMLFLEPELSIETQIKKLSNVINLLNQFEKDFENIDFKIFKTRKNDVLLDLFNQYKTKLEENLRTKAFNEDFFKKINEIKSTDVKLENLQNIKAVVDECETKLKTEYDIQKKFEDCTNPIQKMKFYINNALVTALAKQEQENKNKPKAPVNQPKTVEVFDKLRLQTRENPSIKNPLKYSLQYIKTKNEYIEIGTAGNSWTGKEDAKEINKRLIGVFNSGFKDDKTGQKQIGICMLKAMNAFTNSEHYEVFAKYPRFGFSEMIKNENFKIILLEILKNSNIEEFKNCDKIDDSHVKKFRYISAKIQKACKEADLGTISNRCFKDGKNHGLNSSRLAQILGAFNPGLTELS